MHSTARKGSGRAISTPRSRGSNKRREGNASGGSAGARNARALSPAGRDAGLALGRRPARPAAPVRAQPMSLRWRSLSRPKRSAASAALSSRSRDGAAARTCEVSSLRSHVRLAWRWLWGERPEHRAPPRRTHRGCWLVAHSAVTVRDSCRLSERNAERATGHQTPRRAQRGKKEPRACAAARAQGRARAKTARRDKRLEPNRSGTSHAAPRRYSTSTSSNGRAPSMRP